MVFSPLQFMFVDKAYSVVGLMPYWAQGFPVWHGGVDVFKKIGACGCEGQNEAQNLFGEQVLRGV
jgi:hypothetical protein